MDSKHFTIVLAELKVGMIMDIISKAQFLFLKVAFAHLLNKVMTIKEIIR